MANLRKANLISTGAASRLTPKMSHGSSSGSMVVGLVVAWLVGYVNRVESGGVWMPFVGWQWWAAGCLSK